MLGLAIVASVLTLLGIFVLDRPIAGVLGAYEPWPIWDRGIDWLEYVIGLPLHPLLSSVVLAIGMLVTVSVPRLRRYAHAWILMAGVHIVSRFAVNHLKDFTGRLRPRNWHGGDTFFEGGVSFPSGHVTLFGTIALGLAVLYPRARAPMLGVIIFVSLARMAVNAHWLSDTTSAVAVIAFLTYGIGFLLVRATARA